MIWVWAGARRALASGMAVSLGSLLYTLRIRPTIREETDKTLHADSVFNALVATPCVSRASMPRDFYSSPPSPRSSPDRQAQAPAPSVSPPRIEKNCAQLRPLSAFTPLPPAPTHPFINRAIRTDFPRVSHTPSTHPPTP